MINKRPKWKVFEGLGLPVAWPRGVGCASNDTGHPKTPRVLGVPAMRCSQQRAAGVS